MRQEEYQVTSTMRFWRSRRGADEDGAVDLSSCDMKRCNHGLCERCGYPMHSAIHGPISDAPAGSKPFGHRFAPKGETCLRCMDCELRYADFPLDMTIPDAQWAAINNGDPAGVLCPLCIVARLSNLPGAVAVRAFLEVAKPA